MIAMDFEPPFQETYKTLLQNTTHEQEAFDDHHDNDSVIEECELPLIDLSRLNFGGQEERNECVNEMVRAAKQWGFFQLLNHGIPEQVVERMQCEQKRLFHQPFATKVDKGFLNLSANSYRWGNPGATYLQQFSWSEAFHISVADIPMMKEHNNLRSTTEAFVKLVSGLARSLAELLAQPLGVDSVYFKDNCPPDASYIRLNRYAPCPSSSQVSGLISHTDTDFLTILFQDQVGGLELFKDGTWLSVKPNPQTLIVNVGDLFEALSNGVYKSIKHRVVMKQEVERFSVAYFYCPSYDVVIRCHGEPAAYKEFTLREYKQQTLIDVQKTGDKIGLSRFLL